MIISRAITLLVLPVQTAINAVYDRVRKLTGFLSFFLKQDEPRTAAGVFDHLKKLKITIKDIYDEKGRL